MVQTRSAAKKIEQVRNADGMVTKDTPIEHPPGNRAQSLAKKRRREGSTAAPKKRRQGKPAELCRLNLDVLSLIAAYIPPIVLLNLARTCKSLRQLLMHKSSAFVWKAARRQVNSLPDCPVDLSEPAYANLVFYACCYECGKYAPTVLWQMRRRYCLDCRVGRLCSLSSCHEVIRKNTFLATEQITIEGAATTWVDREQMESFMHDYNHSSNKTQFLKDKDELHGAIRMHARQCEKWQRDEALEREVYLNACRRRDNNIIRRLKQLGYGPEVTYFGSYGIKLRCKALFGKPEPLTDDEWNRIWPEWLETMNSFRSQRLNNAVYQRRRRSLASEYANYVMHPSPNTPTFDLLPHAVDVACFPPFRNIIRAPEGTQMNDKPFESALAQLPELVDEWRKKLDAEVAELVKIPFQLSSKSTSDGRVVASTSTTSSGSSQTPTDKLRLACALFSHGSTRGLFTHPEVFFSSMRHYEYPRHHERDLGRTRPIWDRHGIDYIAQAPYVIHACGLDPNVATVDDMENRNARLKCLSCDQGSCVRHWRDAVWHAHSYHQSLRFRSPHWQVVSDEHVAAIQAAELSFQKESIPEMSRCLICLPCVGNAMDHCDITPHLKDVHNIKEADVQRGVHYVSLGTRHDVYSVEMVEEEGKVTFREPRYINLY